MKLIADRLAPMTSFAEGTAGGNGAGQVVINISGLNPQATVEGRVIESDESYDSHLRLNSSDSINAEDVE